MTETPEIVIVVLDGLRPDLVTPEIMPVLRKFLDASANFTNSRCVFPSQTRVNAAALGAGAGPTQTGIVMNKLFDPKVFETKILHTGMRDDIAAARDAYNGKYVDTVTLGDALAAAGRKFAVISTASTGTTHLVNPNAEANGQVTINLRDWTQSTPRDLADKLDQSFGPIAAADFPNTDRLQQQTNIFLNGVIPHYRPDVALLWYNEPDWTQHKKGLGSPEATSALGTLDQQLAQLFATLPDETTYIVTSDHGHITGRERVVLPDHFDAQKVPFRADRTSPMVGSLGSTSGLWLRSDDPGLESDVAAWLLEKPWCGMVFSSENRSGAVNRDVLGNEHVRSPDIFFTTRSDGTVNDCGIPGSGLFSGDIDVGGSFHGGTSVWEMANLLSLAGSRIKHQMSHENPAGITDVAPTVLAMLGVDVPSQMTGRVLWEALADARSDAEWTNTTHKVGDVERVVRTALMDGRHYFMDARVSEEPGA